MRILWILAVFFTGGWLLAQASDQQTDAIAWQRANILNELTNSSGRRGKLLVLDRLVAMADQGQLKPDDVELMDVLSSMAEQGVMIKHFDKNLNLVNNYIMIRSAAVQVLGKVGGPLASSRLAEILGDENESLVMTVAMKAYRDSLGQQSSHAVGVLVANFMRMHGQTRDNTLAITYLDVLKDLATTDRKLVSPDVIYSVQRVAWDASGYVAPVRNKALSLLLSWL